MWRVAFLVVVLGGALAGLAAIAWGVWPPREPAPQLPVVPAPGEVPGHGGSGLDQGRSTGRDGGAVSVRLRYEPGVPDVAPATASLRCGARPHATGYLAERRLAPACAALAAALAPPARGVLCAQLYGGPQRLVITHPVPGARDGRTDETGELVLDRRDGCAVARFDRARALLPEGAGIEDWTAPRLDGGPAPRG